MEPKPSFRGVTVSPLWLHYVLEKQVLDCINKVVTKRNHSLLVCLVTVTAMDFYLTLPSTASTRFFADNKAGKYKIKLPKTVFLPENDWEVALASISLPDLAPNVQEYIATRRPILVQAMFFSKLYNHDGDTELPVIRLIDTGTVDSSKPDKNGNPIRGEISW